MISRGDPTDQCCQASTVEDSLFLQAVGCLFRDFVWSLKPLAGLSSYSLCVFQNVDAQTSTAVLDHASIDGSVLAETQHEYLLREDQQTGAEEWPANRLEITSKSDYCKSPQVNSHGARAGQRTTEPGFAADERSNRFRTQDWTKRILAFVA